MTSRTRVEAGLLLVLLAGCQVTHDPAGQARCDPGGKRLATLRAVPAALKPAQVRVYGATYDAIETHRCGTLLAVLTFDLGALQALGPQLEAQGWTEVVVDTQSIGAVKELLPGVTARLQGRAAGSAVRVTITIPPAG